MEKTLLAKFLNSRFSEFKKDRLTWETIWRGSWDRWINEFKPELGEDEGQEGRSNAVHGMTRRKCKVAIAHIYDILFSRGKPPIDLSLTPVHDSVAEAYGLSSEERVKHMADKMYDQLAEGKFKDELYKVIVDQVIFGSGVMKQTLHSVKRNRWEERIPTDGDEQSNLENIQYEMVESHEVQPKAVRVDLWDVYPDLTNDNLQESRGVFEVNITTEEGLAEMSTEVKEYDEDGNPVYKYDRENIGKILNGAYVAGKYSDIAEDRGPHRESIS